MGKFTVTHEINCTPETFWKLFLDKEFNEELYLKGLAFPEWKILDQRETDTTVTRKTSGVPKMDLPGPVQKLLGSGFRYVEDGSMEKAAKVWRWKLIPSTMADKLRQEGELRIEPIGDKRVRRVVELVNEAKIFGLGGLVESSAEKSLRDGWNKSAAFMNKWIADKGL